MGLIEPLVLDQNHCLLAGAHRQAAILHLRETKPKIFAERFPNAQVSVQVMPFEAAAEPDLALAIEAAENEKRRGDALLSPWARALPNHWDYRGSCNSFCYYADGHQSLDELRRFVEISEACQHTADYP